MFCNVLTFHFHRNTLKTISPFCGTFYSFLKSKKQHGQFEYPRNRIHKKCIHDSLKNQGCLLQHVVNVTKSLKYSIHICLCLFRDSSLVWKGVTRDVNLFKRWYNLQETLKPLSQSHDLQELSFITLRKREELSFCCWRASWSYQINLSLSQEVIIWKQR
jgi:hypothetical protein